MAGCAVQPVVLAELGEVEGGLVVQDSNVLTCPPTTPPVRTSALPRPHDELGGKSRLAGLGSALITQNGRLASDS